VTTRRDFIKTTAGAGAGLLLGERAFALNGERSHAFGITNDSVLFDAAAVPINGAGAGQVVGTVVVARNIGDPAAQRIQRLTGSDVVFFAIDRGGNIRIAAATGRLSDRSHTASVLTSLIKAEKPGADAEATAGMLTSMQMDTSMQATMAKENVIDGHTYIWTIKPLYTASGRAIGGVLAVRDRLAYTITKHAVAGLTKALALDHSHTGVRFNAICPGRVETPFVKARLREYPDPEAAYREMAGTQAIGRMGRPDEIARMAVYLASDEAAFVTGQTICVNGGLTPW